MLQQHRLFEYTKANELLVGKGVIEAQRVKQIIKELQQQKKMVENWRLDIFCRDPASIARPVVTSVDPTSAAASYGRYSISLAKRSYQLSIAYFHSEEEAKKVIETVQAYITLRYGG